MEYNREFLTHVRINEITRARGALCMAFLWSGSPQGWDAWHNVCLALDEIAKAAKIVQGVED